MIYPPIYQTAVGTPRDLGSLLSMKSQGFGANPEYYLQHLGTEGHTGIDWPCAIGTPVYAACDGKITHLGTNFDPGSTGAGVFIDYGEGEVITWHHSANMVSLGQRVRRGQQIGLSGNSGLSTGPHLHLEVRPRPLAYNNGFYGAVDPEPLLAWAPFPQSTKVMSEEEVRKEYVLAFYREPDATELAYWTGKPLLAFLNTAIKDRAEFLKSHE